MFSFLVFDDFKVFGSKSLGKKLLSSEGTPFKESKVTLISVRHGRVVSAMDGDDWINIKGIGWQFGGPDILRPDKDKELVFGLLDEKSAKREKEVSAHLQAISGEYPKVLGYTKLRDIKMPKEIKFVEDITFNNNIRVEPCVLYTKVKSPFRMADMAFLSDNGKREVVDFYSAYFDCEQKDFMEHFALRLGKSIGFLHTHGIINDSLYWDNITMCAEIVDYEWLTVPGMRLPNGEDASNIMIRERKEKEIIYAIEAILRTADILFIPRDFYRILDMLLTGYGQYNKNFVRNSEMLIRLSKREKIIC